MKTTFFKQKSAQIGLLNLLIILILFLSGCRHADDKPTVLTVFAAASLTESFTDMATEFEEIHPNVKVLVNFAGSQTLRLQLEAGAPADILAVANQPHMQALHQHKLVEKPLIFAHNELVVIVPATNPAKIHTLADLAQPNLKLVLAGAEVPVGRYSRELLQNLNRVMGSAYAETVLANLVSEEDNVKGVVSKIALGEADAGIVYRSEVTDNAATLTIPFEIPTEANIIAQYPIALVTGRSQTTLAEQFVTFVLSAEGQAILKKHGFKQLEAS